MKLSEKIFMLRKAKAMTQEELAVQLNVSRQAVSRWEMGSAMPDAANILQLSKLFGVTTDYLLNDAYIGDSDLPKVKEVREDGYKQALFFLSVLECMALLIQIMTAFVLENWFFSLLSFLPFLAIVAGFSHANRKHRPSPQTARFCRSFYQITAWLGLYFPIRFLISAARALLSLSFSRLVFECVVAALYLAAAASASLSIEKRYLQQKENTDQ